MSSNAHVHVREMEINDIPLLADYWLLSKTDHLVGMGVDIQKLPTRELLTQMLHEQITSPLAKKKSYALIWLLDDKPIGHSNVNNIEFGEQATMHLHLWSAVNRQNGIGTTLVKKSLPLYFEKLQLKKLICEPYALNPAPNKTLKKIGFEFIKKHITIPGSLNFEQEVNRWELSLEKYLRLNLA